LIDQLNNNTTNWLALLLKISLKLGLASERKQVVERSQLRKLLSSGDFNRQRSVMMSITITISAIQSPMPDVMQMRCRTVAIHRRSDRSLWAKITLADEAPRTSS